MKGEILGDKYRIEKRIGTGGFGEVYKGFDLKLKREIAVKILSDVGDEGGFKVRFQREIESLAKMNHPNIVTVFDCGEHNNRPFLVMEIVNGPSLHQLTARNSPSTEEVHLIANQVCSAMSYAHELDIIHRDLTLKNIMVTREDEKGMHIKILDFGLVKLLGSEQTTGKSMMGTPLYMSPEQITGSRIDGRTDIFTFGVDLYRILNGYFPFKGEHPAAIMYSIVNEEPQEFCGEIPDDIELIILKCLEKDPRNRYSSFSELGEELETIKVSRIDTKISTETTFTGLHVFSERSSKRNPYLNRVMISNPSDFFGRKKEIRKIYSRLDAPQPQSISIVGDRRIGKSSLLNFVYNRKNRKRNMQNYDNTIFVYLDFQRSVDFDVTKFIDFVFNVFGYETKAGRKYSEREKTLDDFKEVIEELNQDGRRIILLMDEFEVITNNEKFEEDFFSFLRSMANSYKVAYVTSSCDELQRLCHNEDISDSPFFNIFSNLPLKPFSREEAIELISIPSKIEGFPLEKYSGRILELSGYFPLYIQILCSIIFEYFIENPDKEPDWDTIVNTYRAEVNPHFSFAWDRMDEDEKKNLGKIAKGKKIDRKYQFINDNLIRRGYLEQLDNGEIRIFSRPFKDFIINDIRKGSSGKGFLSGLFKRK